MLNAEHPCHTINSATVPENPVRDLTELAMEKKTLSTEEPLDIVTAIQLG